MNKLIWMTVLVIGCGGDSGVPDSKKLSDLTTSESNDLCAELVADYPQRTVTCTGGFTFQIGVPPDSCDGSTPPPACTATAGDIRDCQEATFALTDAELCADAPPPAACTKLTGCM